MKHRFRKILIVVATLSLLSACSGHHDKSAATRENFTLALDQVLATRGDLCLAMFDWPLDLTPAEAGAHSSQSLQLPVFETLGLVTSTIVSVAKTDDNPQGVVKRYALTDEGRKYYKPHPYKSRDGVEHPRDICVAHITLDKLTHWQLDTHDAQHPTAVVSYTYRVDPAPWMNNADAQRVLPMVVRVIKGAGGGLQLHQGFILGEHGWTATSGPV